MSSQLSIQGHIIELDEEISYNFQVADIADFSRLKSNYTSAFQVPKTSDVVALFEGLGVPADTSTIPYSINNVQCLDNYNIVYTGTLVVMKTEELYYQVSVISGIKDVASVLGDATLGEVVYDLIDLKTVQNVRDGFRFGTPIRFLIAEYAEREVSSNIIDADVVASSVPLIDIINRIFSSAGFTYSLPPSISLVDEVIVLPVPPLVDYAKNGTTHRELIKNYVVATVTSGQEPPYPLVWNSSTGDSYFSVISGNTQIRCNTNGTYRLEFKKFASFMQYTGTPERYGMIVQILVNGSLYGQFIGDAEYYNRKDITYTTVFDLNTNDIITVKCLTPQNNLNINTNRAYGTDGVLTISGVEKDDDKLKNIINFKLTDIIKEFAYRYMLMPIQSGNHIDFISLYDILTEWDTVDWSDRYIRRTDEVYTLNYAQNNWLRHSYVDEDDDHYDLNLQSNNQNIAASKDIIKSNFFAPDENGIYEIYEQESGKGTKTNNRYFFSKREQRVSEGDIKIVRGSIPGGMVLTSGLTLNYAEYTAGFNQSERWYALSSILEDTRVHSIDLNLSMVDITQLDFNRLYYFEQEAAYYFLNRLKYTKDEVAKAEFLKVKRFYPLSKMVHWDNQSSRNVYMWTDIDDTVHMVPGQDGDYKIRRNVGYNYFVTIQVDTLGSGVKIVITDEGDYYLEMIKGNSTTSFNIPLTVQGDLSLTITNV